jgi:mRNA interferase MazF
MKIKRGDVVLVEVIFSDRSGSKLRPAMVLSGPAYNRERQEIVIAAITSNVDRILPGDSKITAWQEAGLKVPSLVTAIIQTVKKSLLRKRLGEMSPADQAKAERSIRAALGFEAASKK